MCACSVWQGFSGPVGTPGVRGEDGNPGPRVSAWHSINSIKLTCMCLVCGKKSEHRKVPLS